MSSPIRRLRNSDPALDYAPPWARDPVRPIHGYSAVPRIEPRSSNQGLDAGHAFSDDDVEIEVRRRRALAADPIPQSLLGAPNLLPSVLKMCAVWGIAALGAWVLLALAGVNQSSNENAPVKGAPPPIAMNSVKPAQDGSLTAVPPIVHDGSAPANDPRLQAKESALAASKSPQSMEVAAVVAADRPPLQAVTSMPGSSYVPLPAQATPAAAVNEPQAMVSTPLAKAAIETSTQPVTSVPSNSSPLMAGVAAVPTVTESPPPAKIGPQSQTFGTTAMLDNDEIVRLIKRGKDFLKNGDFISARLLLQRAADAGNADAALALGSTFDPFVIKRLGALAVKADVDSARKWYQRAADLGSSLASLQLANLARAR